ncbi:MAG: hypothetical protein JJU21_00930 [Salinarimonas sp.]|nr:hypothetical protein [Salinarimonas sp.]
MEFSGVTKPILSSSQAALQRTDAPMSAAAVRTQLPKDAAVQQVERAAAMQLETRTGSQRQGMLAGLMQRTLMLAKARRAVAKATAGGEQTPVSATDALRLRAYAGAADQEQQTPPDIEHEDRKV